MPISNRLKSISDTLEKVRKDHRFYKVTSKGDGFSTTHTQISSHPSAWKKNPAIVYSPATGLAGHPDDIVQFLRHRDDSSDTSSAEVLRAFEADKAHWITHRNREDPSHIKMIEEMRENRKNVASTSKKMDLVESDQIIDLYQKIREMRTSSPQSVRTSKADVMKGYLKNLEDPTVCYRIHKCAPDGTGIRKAIVGSTSNKTVPLSQTSSSPLSRCYIPADYENRKYVVNFMTLYYMHEDHLRQQEAATKAKSFAEDLLAPYKKTKATSRGRDRDTSKSRSSSGSRRSPARKRSTSTGGEDSDGKATTSTRSARSPKRVSRPASPKPSAKASRSSSAGSTHSRSVSPTRKTSAASSRRASSKTREASSPVKSRETVQSAGSSVMVSRAASKSPSRSPSPTTSVKGGTRKLRMPPRVSAKS